METRITSFSQMGKMRLCAYGFESEWKLLLLLALGLVVLSNGVEGMFVHRKKLAEVNKKLQFINRPAANSIQSEDGDTIDCVDIYKQLAFEHPALKNHVIQMEPSEDITDNTIQEAESPFFMVSQTWKKSGSCPNGTIPVRRVKRGDLLRVDSFNNYGRKPSLVHGHKIRRDHYAHQTNGSNDRLNLTASVKFIQQNHSLAGLITAGYSYCGAKADINVHNPHVEADDEFSSGQMWVTNGPYYHSENVESGWIVNPSVYGDRSTRLFAYWTADSSKTTGCFDLICPGFVQTSSEIALGASIPFGFTTQITLYLHRDLETNNWWLQYGNNINIGYWPAELFGGLSYMASFIEWGGQVYSPKIGNNHPHTSTAMGSGNTVARYGWGCYMRNLRIRDNSLILKYPTLTEVIVDEAYCYTARLVWEYMSEPELYYGGPGRNYMCP